MLVDFDKSGFRKNILLLAFPIAAQNFLSSLNSFVDTLMIGSLGEESIAAVGCANQMFFLVSLIVWGFISGASVLMSQFYGSGDRRGFQTAQFLSLAFVMGLILAIVAACILKTEMVMRVFTDKDPAIEIGTGYLRIVAVSYVFFSVTSVYSISMRSCFMAGIAMKVSVVSIFVNIAFNYVLIFGKLGFPAMGVEGAAYATVFARIVEMSMLLAYTYMKDVACAIRLKNIRVSKAFLGKFALVSFPVLLNETCWALGIIAYKMIYGRMGIQTMAAVNISESIMNMFWAAGLGYSNAIGVIIGNTIGKEHDGTKVKKMAGLNNMYAPLSGAATGVLMLLLSPLIILAFDVSDQTMFLAKRALVTLAVSMPCKFLTCSNVVGTLRGAGDTRFCAFVDILGLWLVGVPVVYVAGLVLKWEIYYVLVGCIVEELSKIAMIMIRLYRNDMWIHDYTEENCENTFCIK